MKIKKATMFLLLGVITAVQLISGSSTAQADSGSWQKAVVIQPRWNTDYSSDSFKQSVKKAVDSGANYINLVIPVHQTNIYSTDVQKGNDTPTDQSLADASAYIHSLGVKMAVSIHNNPYDGQWRALINPGDRASWFNNYGAITNYYADLGKRIGIDEIVLGTEMSNMTGANYNASNTGYWNTLIQNVRNRYNGKITYSSQHDGYMSDTSTIAFWDKLDYIGVSAYYGMGSGSPSVEAMKSRWNEINMNTLRNVSNRTGKQVLFTEIGYQSKTNSVQDPGSAYSQSGSYDPQLQANAYRALMEYWNDYNYFAGVSWWDWSSDPNAGGNNDVNYTPQNKPAEAVMKDWFTRGGSTTPPVTPPAPANYSSSATVNGTLQVNHPMNISVRVAATQQLNNAVIDVEVYAANGQRVNQTVYENQVVQTTGATYTVPLTLANAGQYTVKVGIFTSGWAQNVHWNDAAGNFTVAAVPTAPPQPTNPTLPTNPTTPPSSSSVSIWWPSGSQGVSGVQPFKAVVDGRALSTYNMYWQVDGGALNFMESVNDAAPHKESKVDLNGWRWNPQRIYAITFVAKDSAGTVIATKSVNITVYN